MYSRNRQDQAVSQLCNLTGVSKQLALQVLKKHNYSLDRAASAIYDGEIPVDSGNVQAVETIFNKYKEPDSNEIGINGTLTLIQDLELEPEDPVVLAICKECKAPTQGTFTKEGFINGWVNLGVNSFADIKSVVKDLRNSMANDTKYFTDVYRYTFVFNLADGQRILPLDTAIPLWQLLLTDRYSNLDKWVQFVTEEFKKSISKDTWNMLWDFAKYHNSDPKLEEYDEEGSWPTVIDEYVEWVKPQL